MLPREKMKALEARTLANGCTPGEVAAAEMALTRLKERHPELNEPEPTIFVFKTFKFNRAEDYVREGMARAKAKAEQHAKSYSGGRKSNGGFKSAEEAQRAQFTYAMAASRSDTHMMRLLARSWRHYGWDRKDFVSFAVNRGYNRATASTQWQRSQTQ